MSKIISINSFRGGTGKSNLTANLAAQVALAGKRVAIVDTDIQSPGIHVLFGLNETKMGRTLNEYLRGECEIEAVAVAVGDNMAADAGAGLKKLAGKALWLIPSSINASEISKVVKDGYDVNRMNAGMSQACKKLQLDYLFLDTHPGLHDGTLLSMVLSDMSIIILRPDQQDFQGTAVTVDIARSLDVPQLYLAINKALTRYDFDQLRAEVEQRYSAPVAGILPLTEDMADMGSADIFSLRYPDHPWSRAARSVAECVMANA